jgi:hypothetical protein
MGHASMPGSRATASCQPAVRRCTWLPTTPSRHQWRLGSSAMTAAELLVHALGSRCTSAGGGAASPQGYPRACSTHCNRQLCTVGLAARAATSAASAFRAGIYAFIIIIISSSMPVHAVQVGQPAGPLTQAAGPLEALEQQLGWARVVTYCDAEEACKCPKQAARAVMIDGRRSWGASVRCVAW